jgi:hypothetical protein
MDSGKNLDQPAISTWDEFSEKVRSRGCNLLWRLDEFPNSILISGCQRSGTTMLATIISASQGVAGYCLHQEDSELVAALILAGVADHQPNGRYCFQTTYVNDCYHEYYRHRNGHKMVWVLRNPVSVVHSMLYNWGRHTPDRLFESCGVARLSGIDKWLYRLIGRRAITMLRRACWAYNGKTGQLFDLQRHFQDTLLVVDYDDLVARKETVLPAIYDFLELRYQEAYARQIHSASLHKASSFSRREMATIVSLCGPVYQQACTLLSTL